MKALYLLFSVFVLVSCSTPPKKTEKAKTTEIMKQVYALAVQGDVKSALEKLKAVPENELTAGEKELKKKYMDRFENGKFTSINIQDPFVADVLKSYKEYWNVALMDANNAEKHYPHLFDKLKIVTKTHFKKGFGSYSEKEAKNLVQFIKDELLKRGYHGIYGRTIPHLELMLWKKQTEKDYVVQLPHGPSEVKVVLLDNFVTQGWSNYATFGYSGAGGWAEKDKLYCVAPSYDLDSESFKVSYLAHEGQHFSDYKKFPKLEQPELEYRAKLVELTLANETSKQLIDKFRTGGGDSRQFPHAFANHKVFHQIQSELFGSGKPKWDEVTVEAVRSAATRLLDKNTKLLVKKGPRKVKKVL